MSKTCLFLSKPFFYLGNFEKVDIMIIGENGMNKVKVIATIGPASEEYEMIRALVQRGTDVIRINLRYGDEFFWQEMINKVKKVRQELHSNVSIMLDTKGPSIQIGSLISEEIHLKKEDKIRIYMDPLTGDHTKFSVTYPNLIHDVKCNTIIKIHDGRILLEIIEKGEGYLLCEVKEEGIIKEGMDLHLPDIHFNRSFLNDQDRKDILFAIKNDVDFLALSNVCNSEDILEVNDLLIEMENDHIQLFAKIEGIEAVEEIDRIIQVCDGIIMVRSDLSVELPMERIPGIQKSIIHKCHRMGKVSIVAAELLSSMEETTMPSRAEVSDIANAVLDGADAVMLCGETTIGKYPLETVEVMERVIESAEEDMNYYELLDQAVRTEKQDITGNLAYSVVECANRLKCKAIVTPTMSGYTARKISRFRPNCPIIAMSPNEEVVRSLALSFGVHPILIGELDDFDAMIEKAKSLVDQLFPDKIEKMIITGGYPFRKSQHTNFMKIEE